MKALAQFDVLIIGGGAAGLSLALRLPDGLRVALFTKGARQEGATRYAQGGIAAVLNRSDTVEAHARDTIAAGAGLCRPDTVQFTVERGPEAIAWLESLGMPFSEEGGVLHLTREGGHRQRRIAHAADATGRALSETLLQQLDERTNITLFEGYQVLDLIIDAGVCHGAYLLQPDGEISAISASRTALATGGASKVYLYTSNWKGASGDGIAMAWRAGCRIANMEFTQFHPTCLYHAQANSFLITEAMRGEGAMLYRRDGHRFMPDHHEMAELAPRDVVARAIDSEMKRHGDDFVLLDISHRPAEFVRSHFPNIYSRCFELGFDITREPIPVVPAAHYTCGGVMTDLRARSDIRQLYAIGEVAHTGLHGANRMASNSLLECLVFSQVAAADIAHDLAAGLDQPPADLPEPSGFGDESASDGVTVAHDWDELRRTMWDFVGIVRSDRRLGQAAERIALERREIAEYCARYAPARDAIELLNLVQVAELITRSAQRRKESRGLHYSMDYPQLDSEARETVLEPPGFVPDSSWQRSE